MAGEAAVGAGIMGVLPWVGAAQAGLGLVQQGVSALQRRKAEKEFKNYEIPAGVKAMMGIMQSLSNQTEMPGSDLLRSRQASTTAQGVETAQRTSESGGDVLGLLQNVYAKQLDSAERLAIRNAEEYKTNKLRYANALETLGGYQTEQWKYNELYPYMQKMTGAGQTAAAGSANVSGGIGSMVDVFGAKANMDWMDANQQTWMDAVIGKYSGGTTPMKAIAPSFGTNPNTKTLAQPWTEDVGRYENNPFQIN